jgi:nucleotide-binding universal stress UspA family protein
MSTIVQIVEPKTAISFERILIATDFSIASQQALSYALAVAKRYDAEVVAVHAMAPEPRELATMGPLPRALDRERAKADEDCRRLEGHLSLSRIKHKIIVERGAVWEVLADVFAREQSDLLVMGTHGRGALKTLALGSVAEEVLRRASCPVLAVGPKTLPPSGDDAGFKNILFATDFGEAAAAAFPYALFLAESCAARLVLLHMVPPMTVFDVGPSAFGPATYSSEDFSAWEHRMREEGIHKLEALMPADAKLANPPEYVVETSFLPDGILETAKCFDCDLIVMGANRTRAPRLASHIPWAITHDVLCEAPCPVFTVRD